MKPILDFLFEKTQPLEDILERGIPIARIWEVPIKHLRGSWHLYEVHIATGLPYSEINFEEVSRLFTLLEEYKKHQKHGSSLLSYSPKELKGMLLYMIADETLCSPPKKVMPLSPEDALRQYLPENVVTALQREGIPQFLKSPEVKDYLIKKN